MQGGAPASPRWGEGPPSATCSNAVNRKLMATGDYLGMALFSAFGLWWALAPKSVIRFYNWFHGGPRRMPKELAIRVMGLVCVILVICTGIWGRHS